MSSFKPPTSSPKECREYEKKTSQASMEEDRQTGSIPWSIYATYLSAMGTPIWSLTQREYMAVYADLGVGIGLFTFGASYTMFLAGHDQTPSGRIISRLSKDIEMLDDRMAFSWETLLVNVFRLLEPSVLSFTHILGCGWPSSHSQSSTISPAPTTDKPPVKSNALTPLRDLASIALLENN
ncbi:uncharacterized protein IAS62_001606 [Cryptococcus decagattii]|uniref:Solute carrier family 40 protein n=1 Tax=Cryptococcus decagattii TaxID=1859122 RepID=A0ABZ2AS85_9TREE